MLETMRYENKDGKPLLNTQSKEDKSECEMIIIDDQENRRVAIERMVSKLGSIRTSKGQRLCCAQTVV